jgi:hypothetical protein
VKRCISCQRSGLGHRQTETIEIKVDRKNNLWELGLVGPLPLNRKGYKCLLTMIDHYTKRGMQDP